MIRAAVERLSPFAADQGLRLDDAAIERLTGVILLLEVWNRKTRLTGDKNLETLVSKHCADSIVAASELPPGASAMDVGSGAGFPGLIAACVRPDVALTLLDSRQKACSFLDAAAARLSLTNVRVLNQRVEDLSSRPEAEEAYDVAMSRGVDLLPLLPALRTLVEPSGVIMMMLSRRQHAPDGDLRGVGFTTRRERVYRLPSGEERRIVLYAPA